MDTELNLRRKSLVTASFLTSYSRESEVYQHNSLFWDLMMTYGKLLMDANGIVPDPDDSRWFWQIDALLTELSKAEGDTP